MPCKGHRIYTRYFKMSPLSLVAAYLLSQPGSGYPSKSHKKKGCWCDWTDNIGNVLTYWVLTDDTKQLIPVSDICPASTHPNMQAETGNSTPSFQGEPKMP